MSTLLYGFNRAAVPADEAVVRSTVVTVDDSAPSAVQLRSPDYNQVETDPDTSTGLTTRQLASHVTPSEQYPPLIGNANTDFAAPVNDQISSSGSAAAREASGRWGHGTFKVVEGIEPPFTDGARLGDDYFVASDRPVAGSASFLTPAFSADPGTTAQAQTTGNADARTATAASMYQAMYDTVMKGN